MRTTIFFLAIVLVNGIVIGIPASHIWASDWPTLVADRILGYHGYPLERSPSWFSLRNTFAMFNFLLQPTILVLPTIIAAAYLRTSWWISLIGITLAFCLMPLATSDWHDVLRDLAGALILLAMTWPALLIAFLVYFLARMRIGRARGKA